MTAREAFEEENVNLPLGNMKNVNALRKLESGS